MRIMKATCVELIKKAAISLSEWMSIADIFVYGGPSGWPPKMVSCLMSGSSVGTLP